LKLIKKAKILPKRLLAGIALLILLSFLFSIHIRAQSIGINEDSLMAIDRFLSTKSPGDLRSRFVAREEEMRKLVDTLCSILEKNTGGVAERIPFNFKISDATFWGHDSTYSGENIAIRLNGNGSIPGVFLLTAHYDAIAHRTTSWKSNWSNMPAPGANDNATGVATLLELSRVLKGGTLPFDIIFVLFSAEELGLLGSEDFVARYDSIFGDRILGVLNVDMIGYSPSGKEGCTIYSNHYSGWLAELVETYALANFNLNNFNLWVFKPALANSDHAPFWEEGVTAITFVEPVDEHGFFYYPYYHTINDTIGNVNFSQVRKIACIIEGFLNSFADDSLPDYTVLNSDIIFKRFGGPTSRRSFTLGDTISVEIYVRNIGPVAGDSELNLSVQVENASSRNEVFNSPIENLGPFEYFKIEILLVLDNGYVGGNILRAFLSVEGEDASSDNNYAQATFSVVDENGSAVISHSFQPNPIKGSFKDASFCINLRSERSFYVELFTLEGESIAGSLVDVSSPPGVRAGLNCYRCGDLFDSITELSSGIYIYRVIIYNGTLVEGRETGKFAITK